MTLLRLLISIIVLTFCIIIAVPVLGEGTSEPSMEVEYGSESLVVDEGEGRVRFTVTNPTVENFRVVFLLKDEEIPEGLEGYFTTVHATLGPGEEIRSTLVLYELDPEEAVPEGNMTVRVLWGKDLVLTGPGTVEASTVEGRWSRSFDVLDEYPSIYGPLTYLILMVMVVVVAFFILYPAFNERHDMVRADDIEPPT